MRIRRSGQSGTFASPHPAPNWRCLANDVNDVPSTHDRYFPHLAKLQSWVFSRPLWVWRGDLYLSLCVYDPCPSFLPKPHPRISSSPFLEVPHSSAYRDWVQEPMSFHEVVGTAGTPERMEAEGVRRVMRRTVPEEVDMQEAI